jgi:hypothetical protein
VPFGPKKVEISGATPSNGLSNGFDLIKSLSLSTILRTGKLVILCTCVSGPTPSNATGIVVDVEGAPFPLPSHPVFCAGILEKFRGVGTKYKYGFHTGPQGYST